MSTEYAVHVEPFAERYYIKNFRKKYNKAWDAAWTAELLLFKKFDLLFGTSMVETIRQENASCICKTELRITGKESRKSSGNRCIVAIDTEKRIARILLVYHKNDLPGKTTETAVWKRIVRENYKEYAHIL